MPNKDDMLQNDVNKVRGLTTGSKDFTIPKTIELVLWSISLLFIVGMIAVMPWVGNGKPIPGVAWLGYSLTGICLFGGLAILVRVAFSPTAAEYDKKISNSIERR